MNGQLNNLNYIVMSANAKCDFSSLKYEQLLSTKYFVETCFSKKFESYPPEQKLKDLWMKITFDKCK